MNNSETLLLSRQDVAGLLNMEECMSAVEQAFRLYGEGKTDMPGILGIHADQGGFHIKAGIMNLTRKYFVAKSNANFPLNPKQNGLPAIQGVIIVCDAENGRILALMDSIEITMLRTGAATGVAANYLARKDADTALILGCGMQGRISLRALNHVRRLRKVYAYDLDRDVAEKYADELSKETGLRVIAVNEFQQVIKECSLCVTCTPSKKPFIRPEYIEPGTFIAAVGADHEDKQELYPELMASALVVTDITEQCFAIGELHHAVRSKLMSRSEVYAELGEIIAGKKPERTSARDITIFDSTGTALQDIVSAAIVYEKAVKKGLHRKIDFSE